MVDIKSTSNITRFSTPINEGSKRKYTLMKEDYITLKFSVDNPVYFKLGDYVDESFGLFELVDLCKPTVNEATGGYDYELRLDAYYWKWKNKKFFYSPEVGGSEASWNLTATLETHMKVFLRNLVALEYTHKDGAFSVSIDSTVELSSKLVSYDNTNLIDALTRIAETWECEWWIIGSVIHFGRCEFGEPVDFDLSSNVSSMSRSDSKTSYATRVYAFGSSRNIPSTYRKNLIFDVKEEISGRWIKDTSRKLESKFFPESSRIEERHTVPLGYNVLFTRTLSYTCKIADKLVIGKYKLECSGVKFSISTVNGINQPVVYFPKGAYFFNIEFRYKLNGSPRRRTIGSESVIVGANEKSSISLTVKLEDYINIESNTTDCEFEVYISTPSDSIVQAIAYNEGEAVVRMEGVSASTSVTFQTGANAGKSFDAIFNPYFLTGDEANKLMLPEGVIASKGDTYTINNIIRSKVPSNYFSKSTTELTVEGVVTNRLMLPVGTKCVNAYEDMTQEEAIEDIVIFEDVYPRKEGTMKEVKPHEHKEEDVTDKWEAYRFKDSGIIFSGDYKFPDKDLEIIFQSGALNGMKFVVAFNPFEEGIDKEAQPEKNPDGTWNTKAQVWEIIRNKDYGRYLPDSIAFPENGDKYILSGFDPEFVLDTMIPEAEQELLEKAQEYVDKSKIDPSTYDCKLMPTYIHNDGKVKLFDIGDRVNLINKAYFDNGRQSRIIGFEYPLDIPYDSPIYTVGETAAYSRIGALEEKVDSLTYKGQTYTGSAGGGGGSSVYVIGKNDKTSPSDSNVFSAVRTLAEILANNEELKKLFLSKAGPDETDYLLKLLGGAEVGKAVDSFLNGKGIVMTPDGRIQADYIEVRRALKVMELIINEINAMSGDYSFSDAGTIEKVEEIADKTYRLWISKRTDTDWTTLGVDDVMCSIVNSFRTGGTDYYTSWFRCLAKNVNDNTLTVVLYPDSEVPGGKNFPPAEGYNLTRRGNADIPLDGSHNERSDSWMLSSREGAILFLQNVYKPILDEYNYAMAIGKLPKLKIFENLPIGEDDMCLYSKTVIAQNYYKIDYNGEVSASEVSRGEWSMEVAVSDKPYRRVVNAVETPNGSKMNVMEIHTVYHQGCKWGCLIDKTTEEPKWNSPGWKFLEGNNDYSITFASTAGFQFFYGAVNTTVVASVLFGSREITNTLLATPGADVQWTRNSENIPDDNAWRPVYDGAKNRLKLTQADMGRDWLIRRKTIFTCTVFIPVGEEIESISETIGFNI